VNLDKQNIAAAIKAKIVEIANSLGSDASEIGPDDIIPVTGLVDSAGLLDLIAWFEGAFNFRIATQDFTIDNLGSINAMVDFLRKCKGLQ